MKFGSFGVPLPVESRPVWAIKKAIASFERAASICTPEMAVKICAVARAGSGIEPPIRGSGA